MALVRHINMHLINFFVDSSGWHVMQYNFSLVNHVWSPIYMLPTRLWKVNLDGSPELPMRVLSFVPYRPIWNNDLSRFVEKQKFISARLS